MADNPLAEFVHARIVEDYEQERGDAEMYTGREFGARLRGNLRRYSIGFGGSFYNGRCVPYELSEAQWYANHPDFRPEWRLEPRRAPVHLSYETMQPTRRQRIVTLIRRAFRSEGGM